MIIIRTVQWLKIAVESRLPTMFVLNHRWLPIVIINFVAKYSYNQSWHNQSIPDLTHSLTGCTSVAESIVVAAAEAVVPSTLLSTLFSFPVMRGALIVVVIPPS